MPTKYNRGHVGSSMSVKCAFCSTKTSTYINFGTSLELNIWVCTEHENEIRNNNVNEVNRLVYDNLSIIKPVIKMYISNK